MGLITVDGNYHMGHVFMECMQRKPDAVCQIDAATGEEETNASVLSRSVRLARCFRKFGLQPGDVLALGGRNHLDLHIPYYAALMNGLPIVGVDPLFKFNEIKSLFELTKPAIAFCQAEFYNDYVEAAKELGLNTKVITFDDGDNSMAKFMKANDDDGPIEEFKPAYFDTEKIYSWLISTGGTTGQAKVAAIKHKTWIQNIFKVIQLFKKTDDEGCEQRNALNLSPVQWVSGFSNALGMPLNNQTKVQTSAPATIEHIIDIINKYKPVTSMIGPSLMTSILKHEKYCDLTCFDSIIITGGKVYKDLLIDLKSRVPKTKVYEAYGQTENMGPVFVPNPDGPIGNCGKPLSTFKTKLVDPETGKVITEPNTPGELWTKGSGFTEYYNSPEETAKAFTEDGWFKTGDLLYHDDDDNYFFVERIKMLIKYRNYHIIPPEVEQVIRGHSGVLDVSVTSIPHVEDGEWAVACVVRKPGHTVTAAEIKELVANSLSETKQLRGGVVFMEQLPMTSTGKVARAKLKQIVLNAQRE